MSEETNVFTWLRDVKAKYRYSFGYLGELIGYSDVGFSKALKNETLSQEQVKLIAEKLDLLDDFQSHLGNTKSLVSGISIEDLSKIDDESLEYEVLKRWLSFKDRPRMKVVLSGYTDVKVSKAIAEITKDKESLIKYLKE